jgi:hypothetical protein
MAITHTFKFTVFKWHAVYLININDLWSPITTYSSFSSAGLKDTAIGNYIIMKFFFSYSSISKKVPILTYINIHNSAPLWSSLIWPVLNSPLVQPPPWSPLIWFVLNSPLVWPPLWSPLIWLVLNLLWSDLFSVRLWSDLFSVLLWSDLCSGLLCSIYFYSRTD